MTDASTVTATMTATTGEAAASPVSLPVVGAALRVADLPAYAEWLVGDQRDLEIQDPYDPTVLDGDWQALVREAHALLDGYQGRLGVHGPFFGIDIIGADPKLRQVVVERLRQGIAIAHALGGSHMVVHSPFEFFGHPLLCHTPEMGLPFEIELVQETLAPVVEMAQQAGVTLVIENIRDSNTAPLKALVSSFGSEVVRMSLDTGHAQVTHQIGGATPDQWVRDAGPRLAHLHLQDTDGLWDRHWAPGRGAVNWYALFAALAALPHRPRLLLEMHDPSDVARGAAWLQAQGFVR